MINLWSAYLLNNEGPFIIPVEKTLISTFLSFIIKKLPNNFWSTESTLYIIIRDMKYRIDGEQK